MLLKPNSKGEMLTLDEHNQDTFFLFSKKGREGYPLLSPTGVHGEDISL